ncbi:hypothetical protein PR048_003806 [Dryococelus australis]|uniref:Uncharacterized protein n=1 Tax=Dryococelus australis TaxID=614101 RepID=A0ABQ9IPX9_9NEOP|nr:hypothetical protein PR048_003806 [Dryococelus australis]
MALLTPLLGASPRVRLAPKTSALSAAQISPTPHVRHHCPHTRGISSLWSAETVSPDLYSSVLLNAVWGSQHSVPCHLVMNTLILFLRGVCVTSRDQRVRSRQLLRHQLTFGANHRDVLKHLHTCCRLSSLLHTLSGNKFLSDHTSSEYNRLIRKSYKDHTGTRYKSAIASTRMALNWRAVRRLTTAGHTHLRNLLVAMARRQNTARPMELECDLQKSHDRTSQLQRCLESLRAEVFWDRQKYISVGFQLARTILVEQQGKCSAPQTYSPSLASRGPRSLDDYRLFTPVRLPPRRTAFNPRPGHSGFSQVVIVPGRCRWSAGFHGDLPFPPPPLHFIPASPHSRFIRPHRLSRPRCLKKQLQLLKSISATLEGGERRSEEGNEYEVGAVVSQWTRIREDPGSIPGPAKPDFGFPRWDGSLTKTTADYFPDPPSLRNLHRRDYKIYVNSFYGLVDFKRKCIYVMFAIPSQFVEHTRVSSEPIVYRQGNKHRISLPPGLRYNWLHTGAAEANEYKADARKCVTCAHSACASDDTACLDYEYDEDFHKVRVIDGASTDCATGGRSEHVVFFGFTVANMHAEYLEFPEGPVLERTLKLMFIIWLFVFTERDSHKNWISLTVIGAAVAEWLARSPPIKANRVQSPAGSPDFIQVGIVPDDAVGSAGPLGDLQPPPPHTHFNHPHRPCKTSLLRAAQISSLSRKPAGRATSGQSPSSDVGAGDGRVDSEFAGGAGVVRRQDTRHWRILAAATSSAPRTCRHIAMRQQAGGCRLRVSHLWKKCTEHGYSRSFDRVIGKITVLVMRCTE